MGHKILSSKVRRTGLTTNILTGWCWRIVFNYLLRWMLNRCYVKGVLYRWCSIAVTTLRKWTVTHMYNEKTIFIYSLIQCFTWFAFEIAHLAYVLLLKMLLSRETGYTIIISNAVISFIKKSFLFVLQWLILYVRKAK